MPVPNQNQGRKALTSIPTGIHCAATDQPAPNGDSPEGLNELDEISINNLLDTLAEVAMEIARRKQSRDEQEQ